MEILNKIGDFANKTYEKTTKKTGEIAKETKLRIKTNESKSKINDLYSEIGKYVYQRHKNNENIKFEKELKENCEKIDEITKEIEEYQEELLKIKNKRVCENCYAEIDIDVKYCPHCAYEQPQTEKKED